MSINHTKRSVRVALGVFGIVAAFLEAIPLANSLDTKNNQTGYYLVDILEERKEMPGVSGIPIFPKAGEEDAKDVYELRVSLLKGDLLYLEGQVEVTNPTGENVLLAVSIRVVEEGQKRRISHWSTSNVTRDTHHTPLRVSAKYVADRDGEALFVLRTHARSDSPLTRGKELIVEGGYGHLLVQIFRPRSLP